MSTLTAEAEAAAASGRSRRSGDMLGWWWNGVIYQVYVRSFQDLGGDGIGGLDGVRARLLFLRSLGLTRAGSRLLLGSDTGGGDKLPPDSSGSFLRGAAS